MMLNNNNIPKISHTPFFFLVLVSWFQMFEDDVYKKCQDFFLLDVVFEKCQDFY